MLCDGPQKVGMSMTQCLFAVYLIPHDRLVLNHQLQVACIRDSRTLCVPLPADMHHTLQRGRRSPSRLGQVALIYRA